MKKFPKTMHLPWSESIHNDDVVLQNVDAFVGQEIVVSCKLDGECSGLSREGCHARSLDSLDHGSRHWLKNLHGQIRLDIPEGWEIFGENMYACHSIFYDQLTTFFYVFTIVNERNQVLSWDDMVEYCGLLGLEVVPVLWRGSWDEGKVRSCFPQSVPFAGEQEGYVARTANSFPFANFADHVGKMVRKNHVKTDGHWLENWKPNKLRKL